MPTVRRGPKRAPVRPKGPVAAPRLTGDELLGRVMDLMITHVGTATDTDRFKAQAEALGVLMAAEHALHGVTCGERNPNQPCPRHPASHIADAMLDSLNGSLARMFGTTGFIQ
jgi:hypothetical protein